MKSLYIFLGLLLFSASLFSQTTYTNSTGYIDISSEDGGSDDVYFYINVPGASSIDLDLWCDGYNYGMSEVGVWGSSSLTPEYAYIWVESDYMEYDDDSWSGTVPNNCYIEMYVYDEAMADVTYSANFPPPATPNDTTHSISTISTPQSLEHNILFNAKDKYSVYAPSSHTVDEEQFFDGKFSNATISGSISISNPYEIIIDNLPTTPIVGKCYLGIISNGNPPTSFTVEGGSLGNMSSLAYVPSNTSNEFFVEVTSACQRIEIDVTSIPNASTIGIAEIVLIHPAATSPYDGLYLSSDLTDLTLGGTIYQPTETGIKISDLSDKLVFKATSTQTEIHAAGTGGTVIKGATGNSYVTIDSAGNVGIGTITPKAKLAVDGIVLAEEVIVTADVNSYPDFVFEEDYKLMTLEDLNKYIQENGHLPEIPKAEEAANEGIKVAEMNQLLLQKIEELTLYLIQSNERLKKLEEENKALKLSPGK